MIFYAITAVSIILIKLFSLFHFELFRKIDVVGIRFSKFVVNRIFSELHCTYLFQ